MDQPPTLGDAPPLNKPSVSLRTRDLLILGVVVFVLSLALVLAILVLILLCAH